MDLSIYIPPCLTYTFSIQRDTHSFQHVHACFHTYSMCPCLLKCVFLCIYEKQICVMGAICSLGHSWLCLDCLSCAVVWSMELEYRTKRCKDRQTGKYTLHISINMSCNLVRLEAACETGQSWCPLMAISSNITHLD